MARLRFDQQQLYWEGKALYSLSAPEQSAVRKLPSLLESACLYVLPGVALGYGVAELLERLPPTSRILLLEAEAELAVFSQKHLQSLLKDERLYFHAGHQIEGLHEFLERGEAARWCFRRVRILPLNRLYALHRTFYEPLLAWLDHYVQNFWQNRLTLAKLGPLWLRNFFRNVKQLAHCHSFALPGRNVVLAAAGPSLAWHYDWLRTERSRYTLLAVDTALLPLLKAGIVPDYVMNLDAQILNLHDFYGIRPLLKGPNGSRLSLIADLSADPRSFSMLAGRMQMTATRFADFQLWGRFEELLQKMNLKVPELEPLGSVGVSALAVALRGQAEFLLLVGCDFAYPKDLHHVRGTSIHEKLLQVCKRSAPCNSFTGALRRPLMAEPLAEKGSLVKGFVTDRILYGYAQQLQSYLQRHGTKLRYARLDGPMQLPAIPALGGAEASIELRKVQNIAGSERPKEEKRDTEKKSERLIRDFWLRELEILWELESAIASGGLKKGNFWPESGFAADYLLQLCLPKAGTCEWQDCDWGKILHLSQRFSEQLFALLGEEEFF